MGHKTLGFRTIKNNYYVKFPYNKSIPSWFCIKVIEQLENNKRIKLLENYIIKNGTVTGGSLVGTLFPVTSIYLKQMLLMMCDSDLKLVYE